MRLFLACLAFSLPSTALATCPSAKGDLDKGIYQTSDGTESIRYRRNDQGHILMTAFPLQDYVFSYLSTTMFGMYPLQNGTAYQGETMPDSLTNTAYAVPSGNLPEPSSGLAFHSAMQINGNAGPVIFVTVGAAQQTAFGDCSYETLPVLLRITGPGEDQIQWLHFIPKLGLAVKWKSGAFDAMPEQINNIRLSLKAPDGLPAP